MYKLFLIVMIFFAILAFLFDIFWIYKDCKEIEVSPIPWLILLFVTTPIVGSIIYFIYRRNITQRCQSKVSRKHMRMAIISYIIFFISSIGMVIYFYVDINKTWPFDGVFAEYENRIGNHLDYKFLVASNKYEKSYDFVIDDKNSQDLYYDAKLKEGSAVLVVEQGDINKRIMLESNTDSLLDLNEMENGKISITILSNKAINFEIELSIK